MNAFLIDADNLSSPEWIEEACRTLEAAAGKFSVRRAYGSAENLRVLAPTLLAWAIRPFVNLSLSKNTTDVALAVDAMELALQLPKLAILAIGSGDADFLPLVVRLRERGIRLICVSERHKMASEATSAYDSVLLVGKTADRPVPQPGTTSFGQAKTAPTIKAAPTKKKPAQKTSSPAANHGNATEVTIDQILAAAPSLTRGQMQPLGDIANQLHSAKLIGRNATSTKLFKKFPTRFELSPAKQPNQVRYVAA
jgi:hypothetical protein